MSTGNFPQILSQGILVGRILVLPQRQTNAAPPKPEAAPPEPEAAPPEPEAAQTLNPKLQRSMTIGRIASVILSAPSLSRVAQAEKTRYY